MDIRKRVSSGKFKTDCYKRYIKIFNKIIGSTKQQLKELMDMNLSNNITRNVRDEYLTERRIVSIFDSNLTRCLEMDDTALNDEIVIIKAYYFSVAESIITNGFYMNGKHYVFFSASAGQIRTKKFVAIQEEKLNRIWNTLTCGLTEGKINATGGVNVNKYLAYLALCNSATDVWGKFDIDRSIVVDDFETLVNGEVDFVDDKTFTIHRKTMDIPIPHMDGCGLILPQLSRKNFMIRAPWVKGLLASFAFDKFIIEMSEKAGSYCGIVKDIYGREHDILKEKISIIFTKSQFKMWKYYSSWDEYKDSFKTFNCTAGVCNVEEDKIGNAKINYQMLQTLSDIEHSELVSICKKTKDKLDMLATNVQTMLDVFGATKCNPNKNNFQKALELYPELLQDPYTRKTLGDIKRSIEREAWAGKLDVDGKYTFLVPDLYAFCEWLFLKIKTPNGLLNNNEVYCMLFPNAEKLDCLRSPHLYKEHAVRINVATTHDEKFEWFNTNAVYTSTHDLISKILQFDK